MAKGSSCIASFDMIPIVATIIRAQKDSFLNDWRLIMTFNGEPTSATALSRQKALEDIKVPFIEML